MYQYAVKKPLAKMIFSKYIGTFLFVAGEA
jgi:hypothetical protein